MEIRFKLDEKSDADLIARILDKANGGRKNNAARSLLRHWYENEKLPVSPPQGQINGVAASDQPVGDADLSQALDNAWQRINS